MGDGIGEGVWVGVMVGVWLGVQDGGKVCRATGPATVAKREVDSAVGMGVSVGAHAPIRSRMSSQPHCLQASSGTFSQPAFCTGQQALNVVPETVSD